MAEAVRYEQTIAEEAAQIRGESTVLTPDLFLRLYPLLCRPIPQGFIQRVPPTKGKPYPSTGIRSVQVQIDRMNNVLTPLWWWDSAEHEDAGKLCTVTVSVGLRADTPLVLASTSSKGGVGQASNAGNLYKGSYTNAAKLAFARLGVGHEVYVGATDFDPDVDRDLAEAQGAAETKAPGIGKEIAKKMVDRAWEIPTAKAQLQLAASHKYGSDVGDCSTKAKATAALSALSYADAESVDNWISQKAADDE